MTRREKITAALCFIALVLLPLLAGALAGLIGRLFR